MSVSQSQTRSQSCSQLPSFLARGDHGKGLFNRQMGPLQRHLHHGEYDLLKLAPMLESEFLQVNKRGEVIDVHNQVEPMTVAVACTILLRETPDVLLLARTVHPSEENLPPLKNLLYHYPPPKTYELTRLLPLRFVKIMVHNARKKQLRFKLASGRAFYLQLCSPPDQREDLFELWVRVVNLLHPPSEQRLETQAKIRDPEGHTEDTAPAQRLESTSAINLADTVSIRTVYSFSRAPSLTQEDTRSRRSLSISLKSQKSTEDPFLPPVLTQEKTLEPDISPASDNMGSEESLEMAPRHQDLSPDGDVEYKSSPPSSRRSSKSRRTSRSKSPRRASRRKPSKILSLITSCSWGSVKSGRRESKGKAKGKKH
ncbi:PREDICTED: protein FAM71C-like [Gekko japonicus]|uniref:Protein FAM71C-like n=1 Tax=Gekko japonicus TaxID=146911 RepID=A0ABM1KAX1_GEKJA|nr:PREDICTED: protein FAM71C-like [Gekko japonicus]